MNKKMLKFILISLALILAFIAPWGASKVSNYMVYVLGITFLFMIWASGMNLTFGFTGMLPLMYAGLAGIGAYTSAFLVMRVSLSFWIALPIAGLIAALCGVLLGLPSLRLRGFYFVLSSIVLQVALTLVFVQWRKFTGGDTGISNIPYPRIPIIGGGEFVVKEIYFVYLILVLLIAVILLINRILHSNLGTRFIAIREDDILAETLGINVTRYKIISFFISSFIAGLGGSLYAHYVSFACPTVFNITASLNIWLLIMFGGRGSLIGPLIGTLLLTPIPYLLRQIYPIRDIIYGTVVVITALFLPKGIYGGFLQRSKRTKRSLVDNSKKAEGGKNAT